MTRPMTAIDIRFRQGQAAQRRADLRIVEGVAREYLAKADDKSTPLEQAVIYRERSVACDLIAERIRATGAKANKGKRRTKR